MQTIGWDVEAIRKHFLFPGAGRIVTNNAASTQPPRELLTLYRTLSPDYENVHRGQSDASQLMTGLFESSYDTIARYLGAPGRNNIVVCRNTTEAHNTVMYSMLTDFRDGDNVVTTTLQPSLASHLRPPWTRRVAWISYPFKGTSMADIRGKRACGLGLAILAFRCAIKRLLLTALLLSTAFSNPAWTAPRLGDPDRFLPFSPGFMSYGLNRGHRLSTQTFSNFGITQTTVFPSLNTSNPGHHYEIPDVKYRVRSKLTGSSNPSGNIEVRGKLYEWDGDTVTPDEVDLGAVSEVIEVLSNSTFTTSTYFDEITSITTTGLGTDVTLEVSWWNGHEQEMHVWTEILDISEAECTQEYLVYFNGQAASPGWNSDTSSCVAALVPAGVERGMYFGLDPNSDDDAFFHFGAAGHFAPPATRNDWLSEVPMGETYFVADPAMDTFLRPIIIQLERQSDRQIVDAARVLLWLAHDAHDNPVLSDMEPTIVNPGAFAQLSARGLDRLQPTHVVMLPYPLVDPGTQPRLSGTAIQMGSHSSQSAKVNLADLPDMDYWIVENRAPPPNDQQFAGYVAYEKILREAEVLEATYRAALKACDSLPPVAVPFCRLTVNLSYCVKNQPEPSDFRIVVDEVQTYYDPARPLDALVVGDYRDLDLSFGNDQILSSFTLHDIQGWLKGTIDPSNVRVEWDKAPTNPCSIMPSAQVLADSLENTVDREGWLICEDLSFAAGSASLASPIPFHIVRTGESLNTPFAAFDPQLTLQDIQVNVVAGTCSQSWLYPVIKDAILGWETATGDAIEVELTAMPGEDEALNRLLSPFELGIERVDSPPAGTPPYVVQPLATYSLSALIGKTLSDPVGMNSNATDGLYVPYLTQSVPTDGLPYDFWLCPHPNGGSCEGLLGSHNFRHLAGRDPNDTPFDVALNFTTAHINQALWAQARRTDHLGSLTQKVTLPISDTAVVEKATELGYQDVVTALSEAGTTFEIRYHHRGVPFTLVTDLPPKLIYVVPNVVVELWTETGQGNDIPVAKILVDFIDRDFNLQLRLGGVPTLAGAWRDPLIMHMTSEFLPGCFESKAVAISCDDRLRDVMGQLLTPVVVPKLMDMITEAPAPQLFDGGQESVEPRHLTNVRTFYSNQGVDMFADLCDPRFFWCP